MFKNSTEDDVDFCEAYKSQILNNNTEEKESPVASVLLILFLLVVIVALSIFGYNYIMESKSTTVTPPSSVKSITDDELKVTEEVVETVQEKKEVQNISVKSFDELPKSTSSDVEDLAALADNVKIDMSETETQNDSSVEKSEEPIPVSAENTKSTYVEALAELTAEIDKERN